MEFIYASALCRCSEIGSKYTSEAGRLNFIGLMPQYDRHQLYFIRFLAIIGHLDRVWDTPFIFSQALPMFCAWLCRSCIGDTVKTYMGGIRHFYLLHGHANPLEGNFKVKSVIKAQQRARPGGGNRKLPITLDMLKIIMHYSDWNSPFQVACICAALVAFFAFLRKSNITVKPNDAWDAHSIARKDVSCDARNGIVWIELHLTKTRGQTEVHPLRIPVPRMAGTRVDPWVWWHRHLMLSPCASTTVHAFAYKDTTTIATTKPLLHSDFRNFITTQFRPRIKWSHLLLAKMVQIEPCLYARLVFHILIFSISTV